MEPAELLTDLPAELVEHIVIRLTLAHHIARAAPTCKVVNIAVRNVFKVRPCSGEVVTLRCPTIAVADDAWIEAHVDRVSCAAVPDGRIITGSSRFVKIWRDGVCERTLEASSHDEDFVMAVAVLPGGARFVSVADDGFAKLWTLDGVLERTIDMRRGASCVAALPDGVHFVVGTSGCETAGAVRLYNVDGTLVFTLVHDHLASPHYDFVHAVAVTPDGQHIISGAYDKLVKVWSVATKSLVSTCEGHNSPVDAVAVTPNGQRILSCGDDQTVRVHLLDGTLKKTIELHDNNEMRDMVAEHALVALPDNQHALSASHDKTVKLFNVNDGAVLRTFKHHTDSVAFLALLPDGLRFVSGSADGTARVTYHGLAFAAAPAYLASEEERVKNRLKAESRRHVEEVRRLEADLAAVQLAATR